LTWYLFKLFIHKISFFGLTFARLSMMNFRFNILLFLLLIALVSSCRKDRISILLEELSTPTNAILYDITFTDIDTGYVVGGFHWQHGEWLRTIDGGDTWRSDTFAYTAMLGIHIGSTGKALVVGFDGNAHYKINTASSWQNYYPPEQETINALDFYDENTGVAVGGKNFEYGVIYRFSDMKGSADTVYYPLNHELRDVQFTDKNTVHTVGYGYVARSLDGGFTWQANSIQGDFFFALDFPTSEVGYAVGRSGTIIKTTNAGKDWTKLRNGNNLFVSNEKFRDVLFKNEDEGYIIGDAGLFWVTRDGGDSWEIVENTPDVTFNRLFYQNGRGYIAGEAGKIYRFID